MPAVTELSEAELDGPVEQAIVDACGDDEQLAGLTVPPPSGSEWIAGCRRRAGGR